MGSIKPQQILMPQNVHIGDTAELRLTFSTSSNKLQNLVKNGEARLSSSIFTENIDTDILEVSNIILFPSGNNNYQLSITFTPWKTGVISFPVIKIEDTELILKAEEIVSLTQKYNTTTLQDNASPLLLPGTTYKIYGAIVALVLFLILIVLLIIKRKSVLFFLKNKILLHKYKKNKKKTIKKLNTLLESSSSDKEISEDIQKILRAYLEVRFSYPFTKTVTSELSLVFNKITEGLLSDEKYEAFGKLHGSFIRTDFIRYSKDGCFLENEKKELINKICDNIEILEAETKEKNEEEEKTND